MKETRPFSMKDKIGYTLGDLGDAFKNSCIEATNKKDDTNKFINDNQIVLTEKSSCKSE